MVWWICRARQADCRMNAELRSLFMIEGVAEVMRKSRLHWFDYVKRMSQENWVMKFMTL